MKAAEELSAAEARHTKELEAIVQQRDAAVTKLSEAEAAKADAIKSRQEYQDASRTHLREVRRLEEVLKPKDEAIATLESQVEQLKLDNSKNLQRYKKTTL